MLIDINVRRKDLCLSKVNFKDQSIQQIQNKITKALWHSHFTTLQTLSLNSIGIQSCQFLQFLDAPSLQTLQISVNYITSFKSLTKTIFPEIRALDLRNNWANKIQFSKIKLPKTLRNGLILEINFQKIVINPDISFASKFQCQFCQVIRVDSWSRVSCSQEKIKRKLWEKLQLEHPHQETQYVNFY